MDTSLNRRTGAKRGIDRHMYNGRVFLDPLYGPIPHGAEDEMAWELYQTATLARLRNISLSSVPSLMSPTGEASSRFEHSVGVSFLLRELCRVQRSTFGPYRDELIAAALLHDSASVPFSHIGEAFQYDLTGMKHEEAVRRVVDGRRDVGRILKRYNVNEQNVLSLINGEHPVLGGILASTLDADNADNTIRLLSALGGLSRDRQLPYDPMRLMQAFRINKGELLLDSAALPDILGWEQVRQSLYGEILYEDPNLAAGTMLYRSLELAYSAGKLPEKFFGFTDWQAINWLEHESIPASRRLVDDALRWRFYQRALTWQPPFDEYGPILRELAHDWRAKKLVADTVAERLKLRPEEVCIYAGRDKGVKTIDHRFIGERADACRVMFSGKEGHWRIALYVHPAHAVDRDRAMAALMHGLEKLNGIESGHVFF